MDWLSRFASLMKGGETVEGSGPVGDLVKPFGPLLEAMASKDADLLAEIGHMPVADGIEVWWTKYPEDFPRRGLSPVTADQIVPRQ